MSQSEQRKNEYLVSGFTRQIEHLYFKNYMNIAEFGIAKLIPHVIASYTERIQRGQEGSFITEQCTITYKTIKSGSGPYINHGDLLRIYYVTQTKDDSKVREKCINGCGYTYRFGVGENMTAWDIV